MSKFKKGDRVRTIDSKKEEAIVECVPGDIEYERYNFTDSSEGMIIEEKVTGRTWKRQKYYELIEENKTNNMSKKLTGYKLKRNIPGDSRTIGTTVNTPKSDYYDLLPEFWEPIYTEVEEVIEIGGYKAQYNRGSVEFGCQIFTKDELRAINHLLGVGAIIYINDSEDEEITQELVNKVLAKI